MRAGVAVGLAVLAASPDRTLAADGPFGIDHRLNEDHHGIWARHNQVVLEDGVVLFVVAGALWEGDGTRFGHTLWQSVDSTAIGAVSAEGLKYAFSRSRPAQTDDPNQWFQGHGHKSFPSGEVMVVTTAITPIVLE
jgi:undecaprenyl-diphosphatase